MEEDKGMLDSVAERIDDFFMPDDYKLETETGYERRIWDNRIEGYIDSHFDEYISTYQIVTSDDLERLEERYGKLEIRVGEIKTFILDIDAEVSNLETRVETVKGKVK